MGFEAHGYKEWQSLDSKWAKRVVRTWAVLVVRKGWRDGGGGGCGGVVEGEMEWWRRGRRPLAVCSTTKCWIMRSDWHDPAPEPRETVLPRSPSIFSSYCLCLPPTSSIPPLPRPKSHICDCGSGNIPRAGVGQARSVCVHVLASVSVHQPTNLVNAAF